MSLEEIRSERVKKLKALQEAGVNPYPISSNVSKKGKKLTLAGRVMALRAHGGSAFVDLNDGTEGFQLFVKKDEVGEKLFKLWNDTVDVGDFVEVRGGFFMTKSRQKTLKVSSWRMLAKSLRPLPDKWHGLQDVEERFRRRYLDILMSPEVKERFITRAKLVSEIRRILDSEGFLEVETPILQPLQGGATAEPFVTHHNALDIDLYLRVAPELYLKRLIVAGYPKVYEVSRSFRNEGIDVTHNPEFTTVEWYESYSDATKQRDFIEKMIKTIFKKLVKKALPKFAVIKYYDLFRRHALITDPINATRDQLILRAKQLGIAVEPSDPHEKILDNIYKKVCRPKLIQPTYIIDYPLITSPLAKKKEDNPNLIDRFQLVIEGVELLNAFSELNDPIDQAARFAQQEKNRTAGDKEAQPADTDYVEALEYGMPPAAGVGLSIDRLTMLLTQTHNIREVILFPTLRPKE